MRKYHVTGLDKNIPHIELYDSSLKTPPGISPEAIKDSWLKYSEAIAEKGDTLFGRLDKILAEMAGSQRFADSYVIVPMNMLIWMYEKGNGLKESEKLFTTMANRSRKLYASKSEKNKGQKINLDNMPIGRRFRKRLTDKDAWKDAKNRNFLQLQALITVLSCSVRGQKMPDNVLVHEILTEAAPGTVDTLRAPIIAGEAAHIYSAIYTGAGKTWNVLLLKTCPAEAVIQLMRGLIWRMQSVLIRPDQKRTRLMTPQEFYTRLLCWLDLSMDEDPLGCMDNEKLAGSIKLW